jgi:hypothetical protein
VASLLQFFLAHLQSSLVTVEVMNRLSPLSESFQCVRFANSLPNENRDTLMYLVGFLQDYIEAYDLSNKKNITGTVVAALSPILTGVVLSADLIKKLTRFLTCLVDSWSTSEIYNPAIKLAAAFLD